MKTRNITFGAMICALYGAYFLIDLQTGSMLGGAIFWLVNIPLAIYTLKFDKKSGLMVYGSIMTLAFMILPLLSWLMLLPNLIVGIYIADSIKKRKSSTYILLLSAFLWAIEMVVTILGSIYLLGYSLQEAIGVEEILAVFSIDMTVDYIALIPTVLLMYGLIAGFATMNITYFAIQRLKIDIILPPPLSLFKYNVSKTIAISWLMLEIIIFTNYNSYLKAVSLVLEIILGLYGLIGVIKWLLINRKPKPFLLIALFLFFPLVKIYAFFGLVIRFFNGKRI